MGIFKIQKMFRFIEPFKSIVQFNPIELPDFTLLIGVNGAGKSHFLEGISLWKIESGEERQNISLFNTDNFTIKESWESKYEDYESTHSMVSSLWQRYEARIRRNETIKIIDDKIKSIIWDVRFPYKNPVSKEHEELIEQLKDILKPENISLDNCEHMIFSSWKFATNFSRDDFVDYHRLTFWLQINISDLFGSYWLERLRLERSTGASLEDWSEPWLIINKQLEIMGMPHRITFPQFTLDDIIWNPPPPFIAELKIWETKISFSELSSWEKALIAMVVSLFQKDYISFPRLLLLDEVDAFLNPLMIEQLVDVIKNIFIKNWCKVIMTTHSPTTCAKVEEESIYEMNKLNPSEKIRKTSKSDAVNMLSDWFMTLEEWLKIFDEACKKKLTIFSEWKNVWHIAHALKTRGTNLEEVEIYEYEKNHAGWMGSSDIYWLFEMFKRFTLKNHVLFIWDCDKEEQVKKMQSTDNVHKYSFSKNNDNKLVKKGIENLYPQELIQEFLETNESEYLKEDLKTPFEEYIKTLEDKEIFNNYKELEDKIQEILMK